MALTHFQQTSATQSGGPCLDAELLASYVDGRTTPDERIRVEAHVAQCEDCYFVFSETVQAQSADAVYTNPPSSAWRKWMSRVATGPVAAGLAAAAALIIVAQIYFFPSPHDQSKDNLQIALNELDAAAGPYRRIEPRLTGTPTYRPMEPALRSAAPSTELSLAVREAAVKVETAAQANGTGVAGPRALAAMYLTTGRPQRAAEILKPFASSKDSGLLNDLAAVLLARRTGDDVQHARELLELAVTS